jgi:hypothetical protein
MNMKLLPRGGHGVILIISQRSRNNGSSTEDVLGRKSKLDLGMLFFGIQGVCTMVPPPKVIDHESLPVSPIIFV